MNGIELVLKLVAFLFCSGAASHAAGETSSYFVISKERYFIGRQIASFDCGDLVSCALKCRRHERCKSASFQRKTRTCALNQETTRSSSQKLEQASGYDFIEMIGDPIAGSSRNTAVSSCKELTSVRPNADSGVYWIKPDDGGDAFQVYCDQRTEGGGWTLVWSYTFTDYQQFSTPSNAVIPSPNWQSNSSCKGVRVSTDIPVSETQYDAVDFRVWKKIGSEFLLKSNINNWFVCQAGKGSLTEWRSGDVSCKKVKQVVGVCADKSPPAFFLTHPCGPQLLKGVGGGIFFFFDGNATAEWPVNDPCGSSGADFLKGVDNPHGNIFIR